ncbi:MULTISPECIES: nickel transporter [Arthrobacter]|uniref:Nickel/cobalt efflux system n=2 Tax=Arthrobacter TaxID=1663 RepID=A0ABU9KJM1_9MICC|nr:nickel transporter [Arthrobacter sp. YJM1]MDP5225778.1 nickel transporter [Arthrobacter sp. YJM1]
MAPAASQPLPGSLRKALAIVLGLHLLAGALLLLATGEQAAEVAGLCAVAYLAGIKHSYDWDHIAAIDNSSRRFAAAGHYHPGVGLAFSLGHCAVVVLACVFVVLGVGSMHELFRDGSQANTVLATVGSAVSGLFLLLLGLGNTGAFLSTARTARRIGAGQEVGPDDLEPRGLAARMVAAPLRAVRRPAQLFGVGFLFGLGFDTATTIGLLVTSASAVLSGVPPLALLAMPFAFAAAMTLFDGANGVAMMRLYRSALQHPVRRIRFNLVVTGMSAASALFVAVITLGTLARTALDLDDPFTGFLAGIDLGDAGLLLVASFLTVWGVAALGRRRKAAALR